MSSNELRLDHARAPDISLVFHADNAENAHGIEGSTRHDAPYPDGGGCHGGLHARELHTFLALGGGAIRPGPVETPAGNIDILPTVMHLLGLAAPEGVDGRVLEEALKDGTRMAPTALDQVLMSENTLGPVTRLSATDLGAARYLNRAWIDD